MAQLPHPAESGSGVKKAQARQAWAAFAKTAS
jgi:hypothetical protein